MLDRCDQDQNFDRSWTTGMMAPEIAVAVERKLRRDHRSRKTTFRREWSIASGATRVDLAAINGHLTGCEIKSARDSFRRLPSQIASYSAVFDVAFLVVEGDSAVARSYELVPSWWGIWQAVASPKGAQLFEARPPGTNPAPDPLALVQLVWRDEAYNILRRHRLEKGMSRATRWTIWNALAAQLPLQVVQREVRNTIKARQGW